MGKLYLLIHHNDFDGRASAAIACRALRSDHKKIEFVEMDYQMELPFDRMKNNHVIFLDFSPTTQKDLDKCIEIADSLKIIDHHKTVLEKLNIPEENIGSIDCNRSGCFNTFFHFIPRGSVPPGFLVLLNNYDMWKDDDKVYWFSRVLPFQYGLRLYETHPEDPIWDEFDDELISVIITAGNAVLKYEKRQNEEKYKSYGYEVNWEGHKFCVLCGVRGSQSFESVYNENDFDGMICYNHSDKGFGVSIYTTKDIDMSVIAKKYGGGGHKQACGFVCKELPFLAGL